MRFWGARPGALGRWRAGLIVAIAGGILGSLPAIALCYTPSAEELSYLALANAERADRGLLPYVWSDDLGRAARAHSGDMGANGCFRHDSCNGEDWAKRIRRYYSGAYQLGENIGIGVSPTLHDSWMGSSGHRGNILGSYVEFGAGFALSSSGTPYVTEDFGSRGAVSIPTIPAAAVVPRKAWAQDPRELLVNYFDSSGKAPRAVHALVGSSCIDLPRAYGTAANGTYATNRLFSNEGCVPVVFEAISADGTRHRWPTGKAIIVGTGWSSLDCPDFTTAVPTQDCGGGGGPLPTPAPTPGTGGSQLDSVRAVLRAGATDVDKGTVQVQARLPDVPSLDPGSGPVTVRLTYGQSGEWQQIFPQLTPNRRGTAYHGKVADGTVSLVLQKGRFRLRLSARAQTLTGLAPGAVQITVTVDGQTLVGSADGELEQRRLVAR
jgi:hypothetical protein